MLFYKICLACSGVKLCILNRIDLFFINISYYYIISYAVKSFKLYELLKLILFSSYLLYGLKLKSISQSRLNPLYDGTYGLSENLGSYGYKSWGITLFEFVNCKSLCMICLLLSAFPAVIISNGLFLVRPRAKVKTVPNDPY